MELLLVWNMMCGSFKGNHRWQRNIIADNTVLTKDVSTTTLVAGNAGHILKEDMVGE